MAIRFPNITIDSYTDASSDTRVRVDGGMFRSALGNVPAFQVRHDQNSNILTGTTLNWASSAAGQTVFDYGNNIVDGIFTCPVDGAYWFYVWLMDDNDGANNNDFYSIQVNNANGAHPNGGMRGYSSGQTNHHYQWPCGTIFNLSEGDNVRVYIYRADTAFYGASGYYCMFCGCYLGRT